MTGGHPLSLAAATILDADHFTAAAILRDNGLEPVKA